VDDTARTRWRRHERRDARRRPSPASACPTRRSFGGSGPNAGLLRQIAEAGGGRYLEDRRGRAPRGGVSSEGLSASYDVQRPGAPCSRSRRSLFSSMSSWRRVVVDYLDSPRHRRETVEPREDDGATCARRRGWRRCSAERSVASRPRREDPDAPAVRGKEPPASVRAASTNLGEGAASPGSSPERKVPAAEGETSAAGRGERESAGAEGFTSRPPRGEEARTQADDEGKR